jgi:hypothetical protein
MLDGKCIHILSTENASCWIHKRQHEQQTRKRRTVKRKVKRNTTPQKIKKKKKG